MTFSNYYIQNNIFVGRPPIHHCFRPVWHNCGWNSFNTGFGLGLLTSMWQFATPRFQFQPSFQFPAINYNAFQMPNYTFTFPQFNPPSPEKLMPFNLNTTPSYNMQMPSFDSNKFFDLTTNRTVKSNPPKTTQSTPRSTRRSIDRSFTNTDKLDKNFLAKVKQVAKNLNCDYKDLLALMNSESGLRADAWNGTTAVGLIQFTNASISELNRKYGLNLTKAKIANMSAIEQLDLVEKYLKIAKSYKFSSSHKLTAQELYAITFLPGRADREVLCRRGEAYYEQNKGLDKNNDGMITQSDLAQHLSKKHVNESVFA